MHTEDRSVPRYHVLLIGIDAYDGAASLRGCVNDIDAIQDVLRRRVGVGKDRIKRLVAPLDDRTSEVPSGEPTLANIRGALEALGTEQVQPGDRVLVYFSGHGTQIKLVEPNGVAYVREALLPTDYLDLLDRRYLFDWEINTLLARIAARTTALTVVLDCCCSGGATRDGLAPARSRPRFWSIDEPYRLPADRPPPGRVALRGVAGSLPAAVSACHVVAACMDDERARESDDDAGQAHGELSRALLHQLEQLPDGDLSDLRWGRIWRAVVADVARTSPAQHPWMSGGFARRVFGGPPEGGDHGYGVKRDGDTYTLEAGRLSGITEGALVAVYGSEPAVFPPLDTAEDRAAHAGRLLRVQSAMASSARAVPAEAPFALPEGARARLARAGEAARLRVSLVPHDDALARALSEPRSSFFDVVRPGEQADIALEQRDVDSWALTDDVFGPGTRAGEPALVIIPAALLGRARKILEHYHAYSAPLRLAKGCMDLPTALRLKLLDCRHLDPISAEDAQNPSKLPREIPPELAPGAAAPYTLKTRDAAGGGDKVCILVENTSSVTLHVTLIACQTSGAVTLLSQARIPARAMCGFWQGDTLGVPFTVSLSRDRAVGVDRLVVIGTTNPAASLWHLGTKTTFTELLLPARSMRDFGEEQRPVVPELWTSTVTSIRIEQ